MGMVRRQRRFKTLFTAILLCMPAFSFAQSRRLEAVRHFFREPGFPNVKMFSAAANIWHSENDRQERELREFVRQESARLGLIEDTNLVALTELYARPEQESPFALRIKAMVLANVFERFFDENKELPAIKARIEELSLQSRSEATLDKALDMAQALRTMQGAGSEIRAPNSEIEFKLSYRLRSFRGHEASYNPDKINFHSGVTPTVEERQNYAKTGLLDHLSGIDEHNVGRRILLRVQQLTHEAGLGEHEVAVYMIADQTPGLTATESQFVRIEKALANEGIEFLQLERPNPSSKIIHADFRPVLERQQGSLERLILRTLGEVLGFPSLGNDGVVEYPASIQSGEHLGSVQFGAILDRIKSEKGLGGWADAPKRVLLDDPRRPNVVNLAQMTAAESNWTEVLGTVEYELEKIIEGLTKLQKKPLGPTAARSLEYEKLVANVSAAFDARQLGILTSNDDSSPDKLAGELRQLNQAFAGAVANCIRMFQFDPNSTRQYIQMNPAVLLPLFSFGLAATLDQVADFSNDSWQFMASTAVERTLIFVLRDLLGQTFRMDSLTLNVLVKIARLDLIHPLLRLTAFTIIERHLGFDQALERTRLSEEKWETLYAKSAERVVLSPTAIGVHLVAHIDYMKDLKLNVDPLIRTVQRSAQVNLGLPPLNLRERLKVEDDSLPGISDLPGERLLRQIRAYRTSQNDDLKH